MSEELKERIKKQSENGSEKLADFRKRQESAVTEQCPKCHAGTLDVSERESSTPTGERIRERVFACDNPKCAFGYTEPIATETKPIATGKIK